MRIKESFCLSGLKHIFGAGHVELYRDDGMAVFPNCSGFKVKKLTNQTHAYLKHLGLRTTVKSLLMITHYLNVELNLNDISYMPYRKQNSNIMYINKNSSHPKNLIKQIPNIINDRLNKRSSTEENFLKVKSNKLWKNAVIKKKFNIKTEQSTQNASKCKRNIIWGRSFYGYPFMGIIVAAKGYP